MPLLTIPRSDGDPSKAPDNFSIHELDIQKNSNYFEQLHDNHPKMVLFKDKIGQHLAERQGLSNPASYSLSALPKHYRLFYHHKLMPNGTERTDVYLYGSKEVLKFRSPNEFFGHAEWLTSNLPLDNHRTCTCKYSNNPAGTSFNPTPTKKGESSARATSARPKKRTAGEMSESQEREKERVDADAAIGMKIRRDLTEGRLFREYELVWVKLAKPFTNPNPEDTRLPAVIDRWPAIIVQSELKVHDLPKSAASPADPDVTLASALESARPPLPTLTAHETKYQTRFCGLVASGRPESDTSVGEAYDLFPETRVLPYIAYAGEAEGQLAHLEAHARAVIKRHVDSTKHEAGEDAARESFIKRVLKRNKQTLGSLSSPERWDVLVLHYLLAVRSAQYINNCWAQIGPYNDLDDEAERPRAGETVTLQQGLWWGAEQIWQGETVRVKKTRPSVAAAELAAPIAGSNERGVYLRIKTIRMASGKRDNENFIQATLHGELFDVVDAAWFKENGAAAAKAEDDDSLLPPPPKDCAFRMLNPVDTEVTCNLHDLSGRLYSTIDIHPWLKAGPLADDLEGKSLMGVADGTLLVTHPNRWSANRQSMVVEAHESTETWLTKFVKSAELNGPDASEAGPSGLASRLLHGIAAAIPTLPSLTNGHANGNGENGVSAAHERRADQDVQMADGTTA